MSIYSFKITKGKFQLTLSTTDKELVGDQLGKWVKKASEYTQKHKVQQCKEIISSQINAEKEITKQKIDEQLRRMPKPEPAAEPVIPPQEVGFDNILEKSIQAPQTELSFKPAPSIKKDNAFINFISARPVEKKIDYLLMTAYYFTQYEQKPRFTLKQLNAKLMQNIAVIIDHSVLQEAINRDYIECLPDLTGLVGASEYRLTAYGEKVLLDE